MTAAFHPPISWPLLPLPDDNGELQYPSLEEGVRASLEIILSTRPGEQLMRPDFGAGLQEFIALPNTIATRRAIRDRIQESVARWEPRVLVDRVEVWEAQEAPGAVRIELHYRLRRTGQSGSLSAALDLSNP